MSAEARFRRSFELALRQHSPMLAYMASMNRAGVPDMYMIVDGRSVWIELKAVSKWPKGADANVLEHRFSGPQLTFLRKVDRAGGRGLGVVGWIESKQWVCTSLRVYDIGDNGTVSRAELDRHPRLSVDQWFHVRFLRLLRRS